MDSPQQFDVFHADTVKIPFRFEGIFQSCGGPGDLDGLGRIVDLAFGLGRRGNIPFQPRCAKPFEGQTKRPFPLEKSIHGGSSERPSRIRLSREERKRDAVSLNVSYVMESGAFGRIPGSCAIR